MAVRMRKRTGSWVAYWKEPGTLKMKSKSFGPGPDGEARAREYDGKRTYIYKRRIKTDGGPLVGELARYYCKNHQLSNDNSNRLLTIRLEANILPYFGNKHASRLTSQDVNQYYKHRREKSGVKNSTINREVTDLMAILNFATGQRPPLIPFNPLTGYKKPRDDDAIITPPNQEEIAAILAASSPHITRFVYLCMFLGARPGYREILLRKWSDVRWNQRTMVVVSAMKGGPAVRHVPIHGLLMDALKAWYQRDKSKFGKGLVGNKGIVNYYGRSVRNIHNAWRNTLTRADIRRRIRPYDLRHQFASDLLSRGVDLKTVSEIMGSSPATILRHYQHVSRPQHRQAIDLLGGIKYIPTDSS